jgi:hypothetical protein
MTITVTAPECWADALTRAERRVLSEKLDRACASYPAALDELADLFADVTEREVDTEVIATFEHDGGTCEIDHLGIRRPLHWGEFAVYRDDVQVGEFAIPESMFLPEFLPETLPAVDELIALAVASLEES